jgi:hypothetical protein
VTSRRPEDFLYMLGTDLIDFDVDKNKQNIAWFQIIKWRLNSRWLPKIVFGPESTNRVESWELAHIAQFILLRSWSPV